MTPELREAVRRLAATAWPPSATAKLLRLPINDVAAVYELGPRGTEGQARRDRRGRFLPGTAAGPGRWPKLPPPPPPPLFHADGSLNFEALGIDD